MTIPRDYQKMYFRQGKDGRKYIIAQMYRGPDYKKLYLVGWLETGFESTPPIAQEIGEDEESFYTRLELESKEVSREFQARLERSREGGFMVRVNGRVAFLDRRYPLPPNAKVMDLWRLEVVGENKAGTVYFFRPIRYLPDITQ